MFSEKKKQENKKKSMDFKIRYLQNIVTDYLKRKKLLNS